MLRRVICGLVAAAVTLAIAFAFLSKDNPPSVFEKKGQQEAPTSYLSKSVWDFLGPGK